MTADTPGQGTLDTAGTIVVLRDLMTRAETAHGVYETEVLHGVRDEEWPQWYAEHMARALAESGYRISRSQA
jgi:hypothetical protein